MCVYENNFFRGQSVEFRNHFKNGARPAKPLRAGKK
jgi:hypothetical protein